MERIEYLIIVSPPEQIDEDTLAEIAESREAHDDDAGALRRWLGDKINRAEDALDEQLPEGWVASIREGI